MMLRHVMKPIPIPIGICLFFFEGNKVSDEDFDRWGFPFIALGWSLDVEINPVVYTYSGRIRCVVMCFCCFR